MNANAIPEQHRSITPYIFVSGASRAIEFYKRAFGAKEIMRLAAKGDKLGHAEIQIGDSRVMLADECPEMGARSPQSLGGSPMTLLLYVEDVDAVMASALAAGAKQLRPVQDQFYGDRSGTIVDPFGHLWTVATHVEDVAPMELQRRMAEAMKQHAG